MNTLPNIKSQSALEFLTTYGWAFLVILVMIGALSYFGVLDPGKFLPDKCLFGAGVGVCQEFTINTAGHVLFKLTNNLGAPVTLLASSVVASVSGLQTACTSPVLNGSLTSGFTGTTVAIASVGTWNSSTQLLLNISGCTIQVNERPAIRVQLYYTTLGGAYPRLVEGDLQIKRLQ